jgi:Holliday junction resolvasome RuvABC endonuclease subunit
VAPSEVIVVGVDLSLNASALVAVRGRSADFTAGEDSDVLAVRSMPPQDMRGVERLHAIDEWILRFVDDLLFRGLHPTAFVFEGPGFASKVAHALGQLHGVVKLSLWRRGFLLGDVPPSTLKKFVTGCGNAEKNQVMKHVFKRWGFDSDDDNECDAFACSMAGLCHFGGGGTQAQQKAIAGKVVFYASRVEPARAEDRDAARQVAGRVRRRRVA